MNFKRFLLESDEQYQQVVRAINFLHYQFPDIDILIAPVNSLANLLSAEQLVPAQMNADRFATMVKQVVRNGEPTKAVPRENQDNVIIFTKLKRLYPKLNLKAATERLISQIISMHELIPKESNPILAARMIKNMARMDN